MWSMLLLVVLALVLGIYDGGDVTAAVVLALLAAGAVADKLQRKKGKKKMDIKGCEIEKVVQELAEEAEARRRLGLPTEEGESARRLEKEIEAARRTLCGIKS